MFCFIWSLISLHLYLCTILIISTLYLFIRDLILLIYFAIFLRIDLLVCIFHFEHTTPCMLRATFKQNSSLMSRRAQQIDYKKLNSTGKSEVIQPQDFSTQLGNLSLYNQDENIKSIRTENRSSCRNRRYWRESNQRTIWYRWSGR